VDKQQFRMADAFDLQNLSINAVFKLRRILGEHKIFLTFTSKVTEIPPLEVLLIVHVSSDVFF